MWIYLYYYTVWTGLESVLLIILSIFSNLFFCCLSNNLSKLCSYVFTRVRQQGPWVRAECRETWTPMCSMMSGGSRPYQETAALLLIHYCCLPEVCWSRLDAAEYSSDSPVRSNYKRPRSSSLKGVVLALSLPWGASPQTFRGSGRFSWLRPHLWNSLKFTIVLLTIARKYRFGGCSRGPCSTL